MYAVPHKGRAYDDQSCSALCAGPRAEATFPGPRAPDRCSVVPPEHGHDPIRSPASPPESVDSFLEDALLSDSPSRPVPLHKRTGFIDHPSAFSHADQPDELLDLFAPPVCLLYTSDAADE